MNKTEALHAFWNSFGWKAYEENTVPDNALNLNDGHYITYEAGTDEFDAPLLLGASIWVRSTSWVAANAKAQEISDAISNRFPPDTVIDSGRMHITKGNPFAQHSADENPDIRRINILVYVEFFTTT